MDANKKKQDGDRIAIGGDSRPRYSRLFALFVGCLSFATLLGCEDDEKSESPARQPPATTSVTLRIAVAEDAQLADAIKRLRGEWTERSGGELIVENRTTAQILSGKYGSDESLPPPDLLIFPSRHLGELCETGRLRPVRNSVLKREELRASDFFPQVRERLIVFGGETMALPVGCVAPVLAAYTAGNGEELPLTWRQFDGAGYWRPVDLQSNARQHVADRFLSRAVCFANHPSIGRGLFDPDTMMPRITQPPFVKALDELIKASALLTADRKTRGEIYWPLRRGMSLRADQVPRLYEVVSRTPGAEQIFNPIANEWEPVIGEPRRVPLLATSGRLIGVTTESRNAAAAFRLAAWLVGTQNARQLSTCSPHVANVRKSLARVADDWTGRGDKQLGKQFSAAQAESFSGRHSLLIPRIIRVDEYLAALDKQVQRATAGELSSEQALAAAAAEWEKLTDKIGRERQKGCYQNHLRALGD